ncbi:CpsD/CapB family tyrosine-protein kinase [Desulfosporosinus sp. OT]|uniref:CpsD/CapB family tyrosine-protein kinase n=1 Tax=Desulfosporosinus sp. OT TaxID=913865 RepID=UPI000223A492|nr:CpsD/CapB family tyrosine-protein kinase [Desulfosporosinus sp. OT]EGW37839.1 tyrosine-protein kinase ywqD [Desulfosporosinus sp. OT]
MAYSLITLEESKSPISEAYRTLRTNIQFRSVNSENNKIMITSAGRREGKSFTVANLAVSMAQDGKSVLVVDADLRNPTQDKLFGLDNGKGLSVALTQDQDISQYIQETSVPGVMVLTAGPVPLNPAELIGTVRMKQLVKEVSELYDMVLFDTPPIIAVTDGSILAQEVDWVVLVMDLGEENKNYVQHAKELLDKVDAKFLGAVLNKVDMKPSEYYYYEYNESKHPKKRHRRHKAG